MVAAVQLILVMAVVRPIRVTGVAETLIRMMVRAAIPPSRVRPRRTVDLSVSALLLGLALASAHAATVQFSVSGLVQARSAIVLADGGKGVQEVGCQDNGEAPDVAVDGSWTCHELQTEGAELWVVLATDSGVVRVGSIPITAPKLEVGLEKTGSGVRVQIDPPAHSPTPASPPRGPGMVLMTRLHSPAAQGAPMLRGSGPDRLD